MRRRILFLVVGMTTLVVLAFAVPMFFLIHSTVAQKAQDSTLEQARNISLYLRNSTRDKAQLSNYVASQRTTSGRPVSITLPDGSRVGTTPVDNQTPRGLPRTGVFPRGLAGSGAPGNGDPTVAGGGGGDPHGRPQADLQPVPGGQLAVTFAPAPTGGTGVFVVRVYLSGSARYAGEGSRFALLGGAALALIVLGAIAGELLTRRIVRPLVQTATTAQQLGSGDTTARAPTNGPPEIADVGRALNRLADRIDQLIAEERETVADMSHRLRTPLTALRLDAEALRDPADAERLGQHVSALERMLTAVIHAARRPQREGRMPSCDARAVVGGRVAFWSALTEDQGRRGAIELPEIPLPVRAGAEDLAAAVDALVENVVAHTPEGTDFAVRLEPNGAGGRLTVSDDGPGLPADASVRGRSDRGSSGLGLDIVRRCAEASGGSMTLGASPSGGALVTLELGAP